MATVQITLDPADPNDVRNVLRMLQALSPEGPLSAPTIPSDRAFDLDHAVEAIVRDGGPDGPRRQFLRAAAEAAATGGLPIEESPVGGRALGGLMSSLKRAWPAYGGSGDLVSWDRSTHRYVIAPDVAAAILAALERVEAEGR